MRVEAREVEQVGDEPLEAARLRRDDFGGAPARVGAVDGAISEGFRIAVDRCEWRA